MKNPNSLILALLCLLLTQILQALPYRSRSSGDWSSPGTWELFNGAWGTASDPPGANDEVTIRAGHSVDILLDDAAAAFLQVENGATLHLLGTARALVINDSNPAADFIVDGTFQDNASSGAGNGINFIGAATWRLGPDGTILRTNNSSAAKYRDHYHGGMNTIPPSAHWIVRYVGLGDPAYTTVNTWYPNLTFESTSGDWAPNTGFSQFTGASGTTTVRGNLDIGGSGSGHVTIVNENYFPDPISVMGSLTVRTGSTLTNQGDFSGTGFRIGGQIIVDGTLHLSAGTGLLHLNGAGTQNLTGGGTISLYDLELNNPNGISLQRPLTVGHDLLFFAGKVTLNSFDLTVTGDVVGYAGNRYVQTNGLGPGSGGLVRPATGSVVYPVGNNTFNLAIVDVSGGSPVKVRLEDRVLEEGITGDQFTSGLVNRTWSVEGAGTGPFDLTVQWNSGDQLTGFDPGQCYLAFYQNGWQAGSPGTANGNDPYLRTQTGLQGAYLFTVGSTSVLPVELTAFQGRVTESGVLLTWRTATELNNDYMAVERSGDGNAFAELGRVAGAGTTHELREYHFLDERPLAGVNYYRLRQVDFDGAETFHPVVAVNFGENSPAILVFPVPVRDRLQVRLAKEGAPGVCVQVIDAKGQVIKTEAVPGGVQVIEVDVSLLEKGSYVLRVVGEVVLARPFVKQ